MGVGRSIQPPFFYCVMPYTRWRGSKEVTMHHYRLWNSSLIKKKTSGRNIRASLREYAPPWWTVNTCTFRGKQKLINIPSRPITLSRCGTVSNRRINSWRMLRRPRTSNIRLLLCSVPMLSMSHRSTYTMRRNQTTPKVTTTMH